MDRLREIFGKSNPPLLSSPPRKLTRKQLNHIPPSPVRPRTDSVSFGVTSRREDPRSLAKSDITRINIADDRLPPFDYDDLDDNWSENNNLSPYLSKTLDKFPVPPTTPKVSLRHIRPSNTNILEYERVYNHTPLRNQQFHPQPALQRPSPNPTSHPPQPPYTSASDSNIMPWSDYPNLYTDHTHPHNPNRTTHRKISTQSSSDPGACRHERLVDGPIAHHPIVLQPPAYEAQQAFIGYADYTTFQAFHSRSPFESAPNVVQKQQQRSARPRRPPVPRFYRDGIYIG